MECNREEARRAREIAKKKFLATDVYGAKKFALKAQDLYPELDGISQMLATIDVHLAARNVINGEIDYYGVLGLKPEVDDETVRKRYRKMAVMLHPDKNKSVGAEEAFKYLSQAWGVFSDKAKRAEYDRKRNPGLYDKSSNLGGTSSANPAANGFHKVTKISGSTSKVKNSKRTNRAGDTSAPAAAAAAASSNKKTADGTFWTVCRSCRTQYEYHRVYLNQNLLCPNCRKPFIAVETAPPGSGSIRKSFHEHQFNSVHQATGRKKNASVRDNGMYGDYDSYGHASFQWGGYSGTQNAAAQTGSRRDEGVRRKYTKRVGSVSSITNAPKRRRGVETTGAGVVTSTGFIAKSDGVKEYTEQELLRLLKKKAKLEICRHLQETHRDAETETAAKRRKIEGEENSRCSEDSLENKEVCQQSNGVSEVRHLDDTSGVKKDSKFLEALTVDVTDSDFCDFDKDRSERSFRNNEIWAAYDSFDVLPRSYAVINEVVSLDPFKVRISWLTWETKGELSSLKWLGSGISKTCGDFRVGKPSICRSPCLFSHKVKWTKGVDGQFRIYPRKGDVWALYSNWSPDWNYLTGGETIAYDIVEVLESYTEEFGVSVVPLVKVSGFKAVFHHHLDPGEVRRIPREEVSRFSHQIPSYLLTGREAPTALKGCRQLDPAATPSNLLGVIGHVDVEEDPMEEEEPIKEERVVNNYIELDGTEDEKIGEETEKPTQETDEKPKGKEPVDILTGTRLEEKDEDDIG